MPTRSALRATAEAGPTASGRVGRPAKFGFVVSFGFVVVKPPGENDDLSFCGGAASLQTSACLFGVKGCASSLLI